MLVRTSFFVTFSLCIDGLELCNSVRESEREGKGGRGEKERGGREKREGGREREKGEREGMVSD